MTFRIGFILALLVLSVSIPQAPAEDTDARRLRHVVLFKFKADAPEQSIRQVEDAFRALPSQIESIIDFEWGTNNSPEDHSKGFTHCFLVTFANEDGRAVYLPHPAHKKFVAVLKPVLEDVLVVDYWTGS